jgi:hypothetical protein
MPSSASRSRAPVRRSPRPAPRVVEAPPAGRPPVVPFAAVFGLLVAAEDLYLAWLLRTPETGWDAFAAVPVLLAVAAVAGAVLVLLGRARGWLLLAVAAALPLAGMLALVVLFAALGGGQAMWSAVLLLVGPVGALVLALRRPVREWTRSGAANRPSGGRRRAGSAR